MLEAGAIHVFEIACKWLQDDEEIIEHKINSCEAIVFSSIKSSYTKEWYAHVRMNIEMKENIIHSLIASRTGEKELNQYVQQFHYYYY